MLPFCQHACTALCHPGVCPEATTCTKKVKVRCGCGHLVEDWTCADVQREQEKKGIINRSPGALAVVTGQVATAPKAVTKVGGGTELLGKRAFYLLPCNSVCEKLKAERMEEEKKKAELRKRKEKEEAEDEEQKRKKKDGGQEQKHQRTSRKWKQAEVKKQDNIGTYFVLALGVVSVICVVLLYALLS
jgi:NF-X1-type zinc finger protein NFXL1